MTTSGSISFGLNASQIVEKAFHILGKASEGEALSARMYTDGLSSLNLFLKTLNTIQHLWTKTERTLTLVDSTAAYDLTPKPGRVLSVRRSYAGTEVPLYPMAREQYFDQPNKTLSPSTPVSWYYDPQATTGTLYLWPAPSASVASLFTLNITYLRRIEDMVASNDALDMPQEWLQAIVWNLANDLETEYPVNDGRLAQKIERKAAILLAQLSSWDNEPASVYLQPEYQW
jgi:hypothetical protein